MKLITDRRNENVARLSELSHKKWDSMTAYEKADWSGNPLTANAYGYQSAVNLLPQNGDGVVIRDGSIFAEEYGSIVIGNASDFSGATMTLSVEYISPNGELSLGWSDGLDAGLVLYGSNSVTETITDNTNANLVLYVSAGYYGKVMLELGRTRHAYVPYTEVIPTNATKGAYNFSDMNRVERAVKEIAEVVGVNLVTKTDWDRWDIPTKSDLTRYLGNVRQLQSICGETTILPETMYRMNYDTANKIEEALLRCRNIAEKISRTGEVFCGEVL